MQILVDADACPVVKQVEQLGQQYGIPVVLLCDTNHVLHSETSEVVVVGAGADAVDYALVGRCHMGDVVVTQDYGVAAMALGKRAFAIHQSGRWYTNDNIDELLLQRHMVKKARQSGKNHIKGPAKRKKEDDIRFFQKLEKLLHRALLLEPLFAQMDEKYQAFHSGLCPDKNNILGIRVPVLKEIAKKYVRQCEEKCKSGEDRIAVYESFFEPFCFVFAEETMLYGYMVGMMKGSYEERLHFLPQYISHIDSWAVCDSPVGTQKWIHKNKAEFWDYMKEHYWNSKKEYELRFVIVVMLGYYVEEDYVAEVLNYLDSVKHDAYYVKMAIAWAVSVCYVKFPEVTEKYLRNNTLDDWTFHKSLSKITDSYRVGKEDKERVRSLSRK